jgi:hypothetical protein
MGKVGLGYLGTAHTCNSAFPHLFFVESLCKTQIHEGYDAEPVLNVA